MPERECGLRGLVAVLFLGAALVAPSVLAAQAVVQGGSVSGTVADRTGAPVPDATVLLTSASGAQLSTRTNQAGVYTLKNIPAGVATVKITASGFRSYAKPGVVIAPGQEIPVDAVLQIAGAAELVMAVGPSAEPVNSPADQVYVSVNANAVAGPMGYVATPSLGAAAQSQTAQQQAFAASQQFNFPSIIFYISAAPLVNLPTDTNDVDKIPAAQETDRNPTWLDASFTLRLFDKRGAELSDACYDGSVQVLGLLPQQTVSALKNQVAADVASMVNDAAGAMASFYPGSQGQVSSATKAMNIVFQDIFPPRPVAYQYSNMTDNCNFGWYFRPNTSATTGGGGQASILGIQTGIVLLKTSKNIATIRVNGRTLSAWNKAPTAKSKKLYASFDREIGSIQLPNVDNIDYDNLTTLAMFPSLIGRRETMKILHIEKEEDFIAFAKASGLVGTNAKYDYVTNTSVAAFLSLTAPKSAPVDLPAAPAPADAVKSAQASDAAKPKVPVKRIKPATAMARPAN